MVFEQCCRFTRKPPENMQKLPRWFLPPKNMFSQEMVETKVQAQLRYSGAHQPLKNWSSRTEAIPRWEWMFRRLTWWSEGSCGKPFPVEHRQWWVGCSPTGAVFIDIGDQLTIGSLNWSMYGSMYSNYFQPGCFGDHVGWFQDVLNDVWLALSIADVGLQLRRLRGGLPNAIFFPTARLAQF